MTSHQDDRRLLEEAQRVARIGSFEWQIDPERVRYTRELFRLMGLDPNRDRVLRPPEFIARVHPDDRERVRDILRQAATVARPFIAEFRFADAPDRILVAHGRVDVDDTGRPLTVWGTVQDVTAEHEETERRSSSERRLEEAERVARLGSYDFNLDSDSVIMSPSLCLLNGIAPGTELTGQEYLARQDPATAALHRRERERFVTGSDMSYEYEFSRPAGDGRLHWYAVRGERYDGADGRHIRGTVLEITTQRRAVQQQAELALLALGVLRHGDLVGLYQEAATVMVRTVESVRGAVLSSDADGSLRRVAMAGPSADAALFMLAPGSRSPALAAVRQRRTIVIDDWQQEHEHEFSQVLRDDDIRCTVVVPLLGRDGPYGVIVAHARRAHHFDAGDVAFLTSLAGLLTTSIERLRAEAEVTELARMRGRLVADTLNAEERTRRHISEALHDGALQDLLAARQDLIEAEGFEVARAEMLTNARRGVDRAITELRDAVRALHPVVLQHGGLAAALHAAADDAARRGHYTPHIHIADDATGLRDELILSIAGELLTNAAKHARADHVTITVERHHTDLILQITDDGTGLDPDTLTSAPARGHIGLASLTQRAEAVGGHLDIRTAPGDGTTVTVVLPVN